MSTSLLIVGQHGDPEVSPIFSRSVCESEVSQIQTYYFSKNGVLMRKWRPLPDVPAEDQWAVKYQVVVPKTYRQDILNIAHETPLAGHLGVNKTC